jgi:phage terminase large subunit-like protein
LVSDLATRVDAEYRKRFLHYTPHSKQALLHKLGSSCRERLFLGGNRTGKTFCGSNEMAMHLTGVYPSWWEGERFNEPVDAWAASDTGETTRDILQNEYLGNPAKGTLGALHPSVLVGEPTSRRGVSGAVDTVYVRHISGGVSQLGFKSYDQGRSKFQGTHKHAIHLDEEPPQDVYDECFMRTAGVGKKRRGFLLMTMTPLGGLTPLMANYTQDMVSGEPRDGRVFIQAGWEDNPHLTPEERTDLEKRFASRPHELEARRNGVPSIGSGLIYPVARSLIVCDPIDIPEHWPRCAGMDFGWTNPTAVVWLAHDRDSDTAYVYAEYAVSELSPQSHANNIMARGDWIPIACDPAGQGVGQADGEALMNKYQQHGLNLTAADNSVESGIQEVLERFLTGRLKVFSTCTGVLTELAQYARDEKGRVKKLNDHRLDALRYGIVSGLPLAIHRRQEKWGNFALPKISIA